MRRHRESKNKDILARLKCEIASFESFDGKKVDGPEPWLQARKSRLRPSAVVGSFVVPFRKSDLPTVTTYQQVR